MGVMGPHPGHACSLTPQPARTSWTPTQPHTLHWLTSPMRPMHLFCPGSCTGPAALLSLGTGIPVVCACAYSSCKCKSSSILPHHSACPLGSQQLFNNLHMCHALAGKVAQSNSGFAHVSHRARLAPLGMSSHCSLLCYSLTTCHNCLPTQCRTHLLMQGPHDLSLSP